MFQNYTDEDKSNMVKLVTFIKKKRMPWYTGEQYNKLENQLIRIFDCDSQKEVEELFDEYYKELPKIGFKEKAIRNIIEDWRESIHIFLKK